MIEKYTGNKYLYELHCHTREGSRCAVTPGAEMVRAYKSLGYTGVIVTDHFFNSFHTVADLSKPWKEQIDSYCRGYNEVKSEGDKIGLDVFLGWEYNYQGDGDDFLTLGLDKEFLYSHPEICDYTMVEYTELIRSNGGMVIHAHPYRRARHLLDKPMNPRDKDQVDGIEVINGKNADQRYNEEALEWAKVHNLRHFAGSDAHCTEDISSGVILERRAENYKDLLELLKNGNVELYSRNFNVTGFENK